MSIIAFGNAVRQRRKELRLTQYTLGERAGLTKEAIYKIENARITDIYAETLYDLAKALQWTPEQVYLAYTGQNPNRSSGNKKAEALKKACQNFLTELKTIEEKL